MSKMAELHADITYTGAAAIDTNAKAHIYIRSRMKDAVDCYYNRFDTRVWFKFSSPIELAQHLARYW
jgi:hypothetical protein